MAIATKDADVKKADVSATAEKQEKPEVTEDEATEPQSYVWLSNGTVKRVNNADLQSATPPYGHWQTGKGKEVFEIVAIYAVEPVVKDGK